MRNSRWNGIPFYDIKYLCSSTRVDQGVSVVRRGIGMLKVMFRKMLTDTPLHFIVERPPFFLHECLDILISNRDSVGIKAKYRLDVVSEVANFLLGNAAGRCELIGRYWRR